MKRRAIVILKIIILVAFSAAVIGAIWTLKILPE